MSKVITSLVFVAAASVACSSAGAVELLTNPDLDFPNAPPGWTLLETGGTPPTPREAAKQQDFADLGRRGPRPLVGSVPRAVLRQRRRAGLRRAEPDRSRGPGRELHVQRLLVFRRGLLGRRGNP